MYCPDFDTEPVTITSIHLHEVICQFYPTVFGFIRFPPRPRTLPGPPPARPRCEFQFNWPLFSAKLGPKGTYLGWEKR